MALEYQIVIACVLDALMGDPRWFPHPVRIMGRFATWLESPLRNTFEDRKIAGAAAALLVLAATGAGTAAMVSGGYAVSPIVGACVSIAILYTGVAAKDMVRHSTDVGLALDAGDLREAARRVGMICGRDTETLDGTRNGESHCGKCWRRTWWTV